MLFYFTTFVLSVMVTEVMVAAVLMVIVVVLLLMLMLIVTKIMYVDVVMSLHEIYWHLGLGTATGELGPTRLDLANGAA